MNVLITNDDGIDFEGLNALAEVFSKSFDVYVVAPEGERSSHSHHLNIRGKLRYEEREMPFVKKAYALWGTPADCAHMAIHALLKEKIDLVVSGINRGANVSTDIIYSGTIAAAREAFIYHIPAMALSLERGKVNDYHMAAEYGRQIALSYLQEEDNTDYFLNVNVPNRKKEEVKGISICDRSAVISYGDSYTLGKEDGKDYIFIGPSDVTFEADREDLRVDMVAIEKGYISLSAMGNDHFSREYGDRLYEIAENAFK